MFHESDKELVKAFLLRETEDYYRPDAKDTKQSKDLFDRLFEEIWFAEPIKRVNYIRIQSHTNMGFVGRELVVSAGKGHWGLDNDVIIMLGTTPRDPVTFHWIPSQGYGIRDMVNKQL